MNEIRILLVDDDEDDYVIARELLTEIGGRRFTAHWASSYDHALAMLEQTTFDICLFDYRLGERSGLDLLAWMQKHAYDAPVILLTGQGDREIDMRAMEAGASDYLSKDQLTATLLERSIRYALRHHQMVTALRHSEDRLGEALRRSESRFRCLSDSNMIGIIVATLDGSVMEANDKFLEMIGRDSSDLPATELNLPSITPAEYRERDRAAVEEIRTWGSCQPYEKEYFRSNGDRVHVLLGAALQENSADETIAFVLDLTESKRTRLEVERLNNELEQRVVERTAELEASNRELEAFCYSISHDLRAPLRSIDGYNQVLLEEYADGIDQKGQNYMRRVRLAAQRMGQLIDDLLKLAQVTRNTMRRTDIDLTSLSKNIIRDLRSADPHRNVEIVVVNDITTTADATLLQIAMEHLIGNAWKFTAMKPDARIEIGQTLRDGERIYYVRDNGAGFNMRYADKLFRSFQRLHSPAVFPGSGIGLATVHRVVHRHGGRIWAEAEEQVGACFYFTLPNILTPL